MAPRTQIRTPLVAARLILAGALLVGASCKQPPHSSHHPLDKRAAQQSLDAIAEQTVRGKLRGRAFEAKQVYVRRVVMAGRERVDVLFSDRKIEHCGIPMARAGDRVWLRLPGSPALDGQPLRVEVDDDPTKSPLSTHYEVAHGDGLLAHGGGAALLSLRAEPLHRYSGALWTCFDDGQQSCVSGRFQASECRSELDVDDSVWGASRLSPQYPSSEQK